MIYFLIILFALILLSLIPIPVKTRFYYEDNDYILYIYSYRIKLNKPKEKEEEKECEEEEEKLPKEARKNIFSQETLSSVKRFLDKLACSKFKIRLKFSLDMCYGFGDAAFTAVSFGILNAFIPLLYQTLNVIFKVKKFNYNIEPDMQNTAINVQVNSIFFVSLANVIYMLIMFYTIVLRPLRRKNKKI